MGFSQLKEKYQFLGEVLNLYDKLDPAEIEDDQNQDILSLCDKSTNFRRNHTEVEKVVCKRLLNNLLQLKNVNYDDDFIKGCSNLYVWLYFKIKNSMISNDIINKIFELPKSHQSEGPKYNYCLYFSFNDKIPNPENLMKLRIFNDNADIFKSMLKDVKRSDVCSLKRYVYKCIEVYRAMYISYNFHLDCNSHQYKNACNIINDFKKLYSSFIYKNHDIAHDFPEFSSKTPTNIIEGCPSTENTADSTLNKTPQTGDSMRGVVSPALGFTPVRKFLSFRKKKSSRAFSNLGAEVENELIIQQFEDTKINSVNPKYNVAYGSI
ncbi:hypothetical protein, conserved [Plasmodium vivax]|uniref:VIR protein n=1 Tax=Plasmodium vivax TaxID=5855 RepID=A0A1G4EC98_PLAVI|nr:hypothetical protein, conserved [Plasmodium vivax]